MSELGPLDAHTAGARAACGRHSSAAAGRRAFARDDMSGGRRSFWSALASLLEAIRRSRRGPARARRARCTGARRRGEAEEVLDEEQTRCGGCDEKSFELRGQIERAALRAYVDPAIEAGHVLDGRGAGDSGVRGGGDQLGLASAWGWRPTCNWYRSRSRRWRRSSSGRWCTPAGRATRERSWILGTMCRAALVGPASRRGCDPALPGSTGPRLQPVVGRGVGRTRPRGSPGHARALRRAAT